ncbi:hypothetical protein [Jeongeupia chitinilytica]|uniref:Uncharacterized protein n=1 Tax=Jeongeupia chitinilytica TaxID=1041641 RepID=A0ABQ3H369_9NEIS|nr:hypothetical protein [Jeongeupia chitinilytica]GHD62806.1 hypothetical protein GCM10007350_19060 [Jeongeupia chitinilytica]
MTERHNPASLAQLRAFTDVSELAKETMDQLVELLLALEALPDEAGRQMRSIARSARCELQLMHAQVDGVLGTQGASTMAPHCTNLALWTEQEVLQRLPVVAISELHNPLYRHFAEWQAQQWGVTGDHASVRLLASVLQALERFRSGQGLHSSAIPLAALTDLSSQAGEALDELQGVLKVFELLPDTAGEQMQVLARLASRQAGSRIDQLDCEYHAVVDLAQLAERRAPQVQAVLHA